MLADTDTPRGRKASAAAAALAAQPGLAKAVGTFTGARDGRTLGLSLNETVPPSLANMTL